MYDTLKLWYAFQSEEERQECFGLLSSLLQEQRPTGVEPTTGEILYVHGAIKNMEVKCSKLGVSVQGSLCKYHCGSNLFTLTRRRTEEAIQKLSIDLCLPVERFHVTRLDFSTIVPTKEPPPLYYQFLGNCGRYKRVPTGNSLYYNTDRKKLNFYDKRKEAAAHDVLVPDGLKGYSNLLRYELRLLKQPHLQLNTTQLTAADLYDEAIYCKLVKMWFDEFMAISKNNPVYSLDKVKTPKDAETALLAKLLYESPSPQQIIDEFMEQLKAADTFADRKAYSRLKYRLSRLMKAPPSHQHPLMQELSTKIKNIARYAR